MRIEIGTIEALFRYPVKSMRGERLEEATLGWHGLEGDRRLAIRRVGDRGGFPFLTASAVPELVLYTPLRRGAERAELPTHVRTPDGHEVPMFGDALSEEIGRRLGAPVEVAHFKHGIFDDANISVITSATIREIGRLANHGADVRRFRPNVLVRSIRSVPFDEDTWVGGTLSFGEDAAAPAVAVTMRDLRCVIVNVDPDDASLRAEVMQAAVRANGNNAGIYGSPTRIGRLALGQTVFLDRG